MSETGLKASTLFRAYGYAKDEFKEASREWEFDIANRRVRQYRYFWRQLTAKLEANEKELEELRYTNGQLEIEVSILENHPSIVQSSMKYAGIKKEDVQQSE